MQELGFDLSQLDRLLGDLLLEGEIARTSRTAVYRVRTGAAGGRPLALKVALQASDPEDLARFRHEARLLSEARHPNVIEVYDFGVLPGDYPFLTMELVEGGTVGERLRGRGWDAFCDVAIQAAAGLAHIHRQGVIHMDVKPANLGIASGSAGPGEEGFRLKLLDFGLAQEVRGTLDRRIRGTLAYTAPEVLLQDSYDHRADLYSLGMTLFELATGVLPSLAGAQDEMNAIRFHLEGELPDPLRIRPDLPAGLARILRRLLARDPADRYASAGRLLLDLSEAAGRPLDATAAAALSFSQDKVLASRLIGREDLLGRLRGALGDAAKGGGGAILVEGREGVGKSRLLREFRLFASIEGARVARSQLGEGVAEHGQPLAPFLETLRALEIEVRTPAAEAVTPENTEPDPRERFRLYQQISRRLARRAATGAPIVLLLDDLQLAGKESEELLTYLGEDLRGSRVLVVAAQRPADPEEGQTRDEDSGNAVQRIVLAPLDSGATAQLVDACLGTRGLPASFYGWIYDATQGSPAEVQQLLRQLMDDQVLQYRDGDWKPSIPALTRWATSSWRGPEGREAQGWRRFTALPVPDREALEAAAVLARPFSLPLLAELLREEPQSVYERLTGLVAQGYLERLQEAGGARYQIARHPFRQTLYSGLDPERRISFHRRVAELLEERLQQGEPGLVTDLAEHFWRGGERSRSLPYLTSAAEEAIAVYAYAQAAGLYGRAAEAARELGDSVMVARTLSAQAEALTAAGFFARALKIYEEPLQGPEPGDALDDPTFGARTELRKGRLHGRLGEHEAALASHEEGLRQLAGLAGLSNTRQPDLEIDLLHGKALALRDLGDWEGAFAAARSALAAAGREKLDRQRANLLNTLGSLDYAARGDFRRAERLIRRGLWVAERAADEVLVPRLRNNLGNVLWKTGRFDAALDLYSRNLAFYESTNDVWGQLFALNNVGILECSRGNWLAAREPLTRSIDLTRRLGARETEAALRLNLGEVEEILGHWPRARRHLERALKLLADSPEHPDRLSAMAQLASLDRKRGRSAEAERWAREALAGAESLGDPDLLARCHLQLGLIEKDRDSLEESLSHLKRALALAEEAGIRQMLAGVHVSLADRALRDGEIDTAAGHAAEARRQVEETGDRFTLAKLLVAEARIASAGDDIERAERLFAESVRLFEELQTPYEHARSLYEWGLRTWSVDTALRRLRRALSGFERLGAETESRRVSGALERLREDQRFATGRGASAVLYEVGKVINSTLDLQEVLARTMDLVLERLGAERGMIVLSDRLTRELEVAVARNLGKEDAAEGQKLSESVVRRVLETKEPILSVDALTDVRFASSESIVARHILSILCVPLAIRDRIAGAIYVDHRESRHLFGPADLDFLVAFADQAGIAIENARLYSEVEASRQRLKEENESLRNEILSVHNLGSMIGKSRVILELKQVMEKVAQSSSTVLIQGESGTGKGLVARIVHSISPRRQAPFIHFNCAALPETLVESELFGHEKGAFTGAAGQKPGRFELANHGTIFLDEIGKVSMSAQSKLLRVVEEKEFERVGGTRTLQADVRVIAATNLDLEEAIRRNEFREDLFYRLNILPIVLPPLRQRKEDIPYLVQHFLAKVSREQGRPAKELDPSVLDLFTPMTGRATSASSKRRCTGPSCCRARNT